MDQFLDIIKIIGPLGSIPVVIFCVYKTVEMCSELIHKYIKPSSNTAKATFREFQEIFKKYQELQEHVLKLENNHMVHFKQDIDAICNEIKDLRSDIGVIQTDVAILKDRHNRHV